MLAILLQLIDDPEDKQKFEQLYSRYERLMFVVAKDILKDPYKATDRKAYEEALAKISSNDTAKKEILEDFMKRVPDQLTDYNPGNHVLTDDKAPVEVLGMQAIDELISEELAVYKKMYEKQGLQRVLDSII